MDQDVQRLVDRGAVFYVSHSGGKDSQAMYLHLSRLVPADQLVVVHADLGPVEHRGVQDHIRATIQHELNVVQAGKTLLEMVKRRASTRPDVPSWPSSATRQCTSDLKRGPIYKFIRHDMAARGATLAVNCMGLRAEESPARAKKPEWRKNAELSKAGREVWDWLPIHEWVAGEVFDTIEDAGQEPLWVYAAGYQRASCVFCIMASDNDLRHGARLYPELLQTYLDLEERSGWTMFPKASLGDRVGVEHAALIPALQL